MSGIDPDAEDSRAWNVASDADAGKAPEESVVPETKTAQKEQIALFAGGKLKDQEPVLAVPVTQMIPENRRRRREDILREPGTTTRRIAEDLTVPCT